MKNQHWHSKNHKKYLLQVHLILVTKYRKAILNEPISMLVKTFSMEILSRYNIIIKCVETDKDHIHYLLDLPTDVSIEKVVKLLKSYTTYHLWQVADLSQFYWNEHTLWTDGYFACSVGDISSSTLIQYINNQG